MKTRTFFALIIASFVGLSTFAGCDDNDDDDGGSTTYYNSSGTSTTSSTGPATDGLIGGDTTLNDNTTGRK